MQNKAEMSYTKLSLMLIGLTIIWFMCSQGESQFPERFEQQLVNVLGGTNIDKKKLQIAMRIKSSIQKQDQTKAKTQLNKLFQQKYNIRSSTQQTICVIVRSFSQQSQGDQDYLTLKSIISQQYKNYHIIYLSEKNSESISKYKGYLTSNQIHDDKYTFVEGKADVIASLLLAVNKCPQNGIVHIMQNGQSLITDQVFKLINSIFKPEQQIDLIWSNSLYKNDKIGLSVAYPEKAKAQKNSDYINLERIKLMYLEIHFYFKIKNNFLSIHQLILYGWHNLICQPQCKNQRNFNIFLKLLRQKTRIRSLYHKEHNYKQAYLN